MQSKSLGQAATDSEKELEAVLVEIVEWRGSALSYSPCLAVSATPTGRSGLKVMPYRIF